MKTFLWFIWFITPIMYAHNHEHTESSIEFNVSSDIDSNHDGVFLPKLDELFKNPDVVSGLNSGAAAINRSVENLMSSIFYSLLDNNFKHQITSYYQVSIDLSRNVYTSSMGEYVIVDRVALGPNIKKKIYEFNQIPVSLKSNASNAVLDIYTSKNISRFSEHEKTQDLRSYANNFMGLLPFLEKILPPSFNPMELYDPIRQVETPFVFPTSLDSFARMPTGSIRSYLVEGGISMPIELEKSLSDIHKDILKNTTLNTQLPYAIFITGEFRINILKKSENIAWVGVTKTNSLGHELNFNLGNTYFLLSKTIPHIPWNGIPIGIFPINFHMDQEIKSSLETLYEYDLSKEKGIMNYLEATKGNFSQSNTKESGTTFIYNKNQKTTSHKNNKSNSLYVWKQTNHNNRESSEIHIKDDGGDFYVLENQNIKKENSWNILSGDENTDINISSHLNVRRTHPSSDDYEFSNKEDPYHITVEIKTHDKYCIVSEYEAYKAYFEDVTQLNLSELPSFKKYLEEEDIYHKNSLLFSNQENFHKTLHTPQITLGEITIVSKFYFNNELLKKISHTPDLHLKHKIFETYGFSDQEEQALSTSILSHSYLRFKHFITKPLTFLNITAPKTDVFHEIDRLTEALPVLQNDQAPMDTLTAIDTVLNTLQPDMLVKLFTKLAHTSTLPRKIQFFVKSEKNLEPSVKVNYEKLHGKIIASADAFPEKQRYELNKEKNQAFYPTSIQEATSKEHISHLKIDTILTTHLEKILKATISVKYDDHHSKSKFYIKIAKSGKIQIGKFILGQKIVTLAPKVWTNKNNTDVVEYEIQLNGTQGLFNHPAFEAALVDGGEFSIQLALSKKEDQWSKYSEFFFAYENEKISIHHK